MKNQQQSERGRGSGGIDDAGFEAMYAVLDGGMKLLNDLETFLKPYGLSQGRLAVLLAIRHSNTGNAGPAYLAERTGRSRPTVSRMAARLAEDGLLRIDPDCDDGRMKTLELTPAGSELLNRVSEPYARRLARMAEDLDSGDRRELTRLLGKIRYPGGGTVGDEA